MAAVKYTRGKGDPPPELELITAIDRFGAQAVYGRLLSRGEALRLIYLEQVVQAVRVFDKTQDMGALMTTHPEIVRLARDSIRIADG